MAKRVRIIVGALAAVLAIGVGVYFLATADIKLIYRSDNIRVERVEPVPPEEQNRPHVDYLGITANQAFEQSAVILSGTIRNVREATVFYNIDGLTGENPITLFDMLVSDVVASTDRLPKKDVLTIGVGYNSSDYPYEHPFLEEGKSFVMFCVVNKDSEYDPLETAGYADLWVMNPRSLLFEEDRGALFVSDIFGDYIAASGITATRDRFGYWVNKDAFLEILKQKAAVFWPKY